MNKIMTIICGVVNISRPIISEDRFNDDSDILSI